MIRKIIEIDQDKCNGCGLCASACHEGAIGIVNGKATLLREDYCDGLGDCLPVCPTNAISFVRREAAAYDEQAVKNSLKAQSFAAMPGTCPGSMARQILRTQAAASQAAEKSTSQSQLTHWPVQIKLAAVNAPFFNGADLLIAADCAAYAHGDFHNTFMRGKVTLIGCPKLDEGDYSEKLTAILRANAIKSLTCVRMQVPCCGGIERAAQSALLNNGKALPYQVVTLGIDGTVLDA